MRRFRERWPRVALNLVEATSDVQRDWLAYLQAYRQGYTGRLLSTARLLFVAEFPRLFGDKLVAQGVLAAEGPDEMVKAIRDEIVDEIGGGSRLLQEHPHWFRARSSALRARMRAAADGPRSERISASSSSSSVASSSLAVPPLLTGRLAASRSEVLAKPPNRRWVQLVSLMRAGPP